jgi:ABC-type glycerol-3-phosphate transport system substrate-binding protein
MKKTLSSTVFVLYKKVGYIIGAVVVLAVLGTGLILALNTNRPLDENPNRNIESQTDEKGNIIQTNYFEQLPETEKLVLYRTGDNKWLLDPAIIIFKSTYPDVKVEVRDFENNIEGYRTFIQTELPAGKGPDLLLKIDVSDVYKTMDADIFADLNDFIMNDPEFNFDDYNRIVLDSGVYKGKRYVMPLSYYTNVIFTTEEILESEGIKQESLRSFDGLTDAIRKYMDKYSSTKLVYDYQFQYSTMFFPWCGLQIIDYENKTINVDGEDFKKVMGAYKDIYHQDAVDLAEYKMPSQSDVIKSFMDEEIMLANRSWNNFAYYYASLSTYGYTPVYFPFPAVNGKKTAIVVDIAAILNTSANKLNAYRFLKIMLSEQIQGGDPTSVNFVWIPVLNNALYDSMEHRHAFYGNGEFEGMKVSISKEAIQEYVNIATDIDECQIQAAIPLYELFSSYMLPYFKGEDSYENCLNKARNFLELYVSE